MTKMQKALEEAKNTSFWGKLEIEYRAGKVSVIRKTETIRCDEENSRYEPQREK